MLVTLATPVLFGLLPALHATRSDLGNALKESLGRPVLAQAPARHLTLVVRTASGPGGAARGVRAAVEGADRELTLDSLQTIEERLAARFRDSQFMVGFIGVFAPLALFLSAVGVFAVASHSVVRRTREIGLRMALGARPRELVRSAGSSRSRAPRSRPSTGPPAGPPHRPGRRPAPRIEGRVRHRPGGPLASGAGPR